jgi:hypothetical protein
MSTHQRGSPLPVEYWVICPEDNQPFVDWYNSHGGDIEGRSGCWYAIKNGRANYSGLIPAK